MFHDGISVLIITQHTFSSATEQVKVHSMTKKASDMKKEINGFSKFILDFIETIGIKDKISIVGHSLGGYVAAQVAIDNKRKSSY